MTTWEDRQKAILATVFPDWDIWFVRKAVARETTWHARPKGHPVATVDASSPRELDEKIRAAGEEASQAGAPTV
jgi:hypothetical protein